MHTQLKIEGMSCEHCAHAVKSALRRVEGVTNAEVSLEAGRAEVEHSDAVMLAVLVAAVDDEGYKAQGA